MGAGDDEMMVDGGRRVSQDIPCPTHGAQYGGGVAAAPSPEPQTCAGLLIFTELYAVGYVDGVPCTGVPGKLHPATVDEVAGALRHCERLAEEQAELQAWTLEAVRRLKKEIR